MAIVGEVISATEHKRILVESFPGKISIKQLRKDDADSIPPQRIDVSLDSVLEFMQMLARIANPGLSGRGDRYRIVVQKAPIPGVEKQP